jgi:hypothetical protein
MKISSPDICRRAKKPLITLVLFLICVSFGFVYSIKNRQGNLDSLIRLKAKEDIFSFAVLGDCSTGVEICENILKHIRKEKAAFAVFQGDFVPANTEPAYKFFVRMAERASKKRYPIFMVAGNHDIKDPEGNKSFDRF